MILITPVVLHVTSLFRENKDFYFKIFQELLHWQTCNSFVFLRTDTGKVISLMNYVNILVTKNQRFLIFATQ